MINRKYNGYKKGMFAAAAVLSLFSACKVSETYERPNLITEGLYRNQQGTDTLNMAARTWQSMFNDPILKQLIQEGLQNNLDLKNAIENIVQAEAILRQQRLALLPTLDASANVTRAKTSEASLNFRNGVNIRTLTTTHRLQLSTSWEADIWGKLSSAKRSALNSYLRTDAARRAVETQLIADISNSYYNLLALDRQLEITQLTLKKRIESVETLRALKEGAVVTGAAVVQAEANRYAAEVTIPDLKLNIRQTENALSVLLGRAPAEIRRNKLADQQPFTDVSLGMPAQLLQNRPDVQAAEFALRASLEDVNVARSFFYPALTLTASGGFSNLSLRDFFTNALFYNVVGGLTQPIFAQGANKARLTRAQSLQAQSLNDFQFALLNAGQEVSNALYAYQAAGEKEVSRIRQIEALQKSVSFTEELLRYSSATNYTDVLTSEQALLQAELSGVSDRLQKLQAVVDLYRALGGGWQ
ncbi:multidrug transporter [Pedobacter quisquiliarum]|uniref:Multidrug transporter n=1 Tax=Pedobacter quisquiliarum TaxID=1834438 RepID=A0A916TYE2_9SPHI|nr:efflux transporter outer membrane subunit [Pedobacter quisquiliarum]GGC51132.1 multidrug transporter [Pedobacter quisquiliarum]